MSRFFASMLLAYLMQIGLDWVLPQDLSRILVITLGGLTALVWSRLDDVIQRRQPK